MRYPSTVLVGVALMICNGFNTVEANQGTVSEQGQLKLTLNRLTQLINAKEYEKAFAYSDSKAEYLGEPKFDFLIGLAALKSQHPHEAVFAFERVVNLEPKWHEARFHLASAYLLANNLVAAQAEIEKLNKVSSLPPKIETSLPTLSRAVDRRIAKNSRSFDHMISGGVGYDSNVNAGSAEDFIFIPALGSDIPLSPNSQETESPYIVATYLGRYSQKITQKQSLDISGMVNVNQFTDSKEYNRMAGSLSGRYTFLEKNFSYFVGANVTPLWLDGELYRTRYDGSIGGNYKLNDIVDFKGSIRFGKSSNKLDDRLDLDSFGYSLGVSFHNSGIQHNLKMNWLKENAANSAAEYNGKDAYGIQYQANFPITDKLMYAGLFAWTNSNHHAPHPVFEEKRNEYLVYINNTLSYKIKSRAYIVGGLGFQNKSSNVALYEYDRVDLNLSFNMSF